MPEEDNEGVGAIDQLYDIIDMLDDDIRELEGVGRERVEVFRYKGIFEAVSFLDEIGMSNRLGLSHMDLDKFQRMSGVVDSAVLRQLTGRLKSLLREAEGTILAIAATPTAPIASQLKEPSIAGQAVRITAVEWVQNDRDKNAKLIADLSELLDEAIVRARGTNLPPEKTALSAFQRKTLIDMLETALQMLKAPLVEKGLLKKLAEAAGEGAVAAIKKGSEVGLGIALKRLWELLAQFLNGL